MPKRSFRYKGLGVTVEVPERVGRAARRLFPKPATKPERLSVHPPPPVMIRSRESQIAIVDDLVADAAATANGEPAADTAAAISKHPWYHTIEFPDGSVTSGRFDHRQLVPYYGLPADLHGRRALDIGSGDGFWAFELEKRGAEVTSYDIESFREVDLPLALHRRFEQQSVDLSFRKGIELARQQLGSKVKLVNGNVYDLDPARVGTFDFVHTGDILLHLRDPALALQRIRAVTAGEALIADCFDPGLDGLEAGPGLTRYLGGWDDATWWNPALSTLVQMMADAGFEDVEVATTYRLADRGTPVGPWRAVLRGRT